MTEDLDRRPKPAGIPISAVLLATAAAALAAALVASLLTGSDGDDEPQAETIQLNEGEPGIIPDGSDPSGTAAPDFTFPAVIGESFSEGDEIDFAEFRDGRPTVLNFFASWCTPCVVEMPDLEVASNEFEGQVLVLGLGTDGRDNALDIVETTGVTYPIGRDPSQDILSAFQGLAMPTTVFIDGDGIIQSVNSGALTADDLRTKIEEELL